MTKNMTTQEGTRYEIQKKLVTRTMAKFRRMEAVGFDRSPMYMTHEKCSHGTVGFTYLGRRIDLRYDFGTDTSENYACACNYLVARISQCVHPQLRSWAAIMKDYLGSREIGLDSSMKPIHFYIIALMYALTLIDQQPADMGCNPYPNQPIVDQTITGHVELTTIFFRWFLGCWPRCLNPPPDPSGSHSGIY